ncbi:MULTISPECIES: serine hydrolase [unclassified Imperialibacter]|uniref:serine hydrolase domain-containing protein n=1 Tax=unclassified Imperialibacter TaxID=2629706 RepID=UPI0012581A5A|nr:MULTISPECIES: serine hydrolase domain-containing protein [unclassified Imperialibacter]CAD5279143.1 Class A beta-lactamase-related serine hydrolase [Imperialibacter sp. 75]CAD5289079.1 Class A beta-lactamase-related serine hydrolase [Imperialibacter sp. 89]VVT16429.1 Esterase EstB [Imperialibacter sp. EC-SDR9]
MKNKLLLRISIALLVLFVGLHHLHAQTLPTAKPEEVGMSSDRLQRLSAVFRQYADDKKMSGNVILVMRKGKVVYHEAFGLRDIESKSVMPKDAIFRIASQTKALVSVSIMMLQEEGKLLITDNVSKYIPEFEETTVAVAKEDGVYEIVPAKRQITLRDLLTHTAGIGYGGGPAKDKWEEAGITGWYFAHREEPVGATIAKMASLPMDAQPGEKFVYGYNTDILGAVVEKASGMPLDQFIKTRITDPLGMNDTHFYLPKNKTGKLATVYSASQDKPIEKSPVTGTMVSQGAYVDGPRKSFSGGAGLLSTADNYARFLQMTLNGGELNGTRILSPKTIELMTVSHTGDIDFRDGQGFGLGFYVVEDLGERGIPGSVGEYGWGGAYGSTYWVDPKEELVVVYFKQLIPTAGLDDQAKLRALVYQAILE